MKIEEVKIQRVNLTMKDIIEAVTFYVKVNTQRVADPSRYAVTFHIVYGLLSGAKVEIGLAKAVPLEDQSIVGRDHCVSRLSRMI